MPDLRDILIGLGMGADPSGRVLQMLQIKQQREQAEEERKKEREHREFLDTRNYNRAQVDRMRERLQRGGEQQRERAGIFHALQGEYGDKYGPTIQDWLAKGQSNIPVPMISPAGMAVGTDKPPALPGQGYYGVDALAASLGRMESREQRDEDLDWRNQQREWQAAEAEWRQRQRGEATSERAESDLANRKAFKDLQAMQPNLYPEFNPREDYVNQLSRLRQNVSAAQEEYRTAAPNVRAQTDRPPNPFMRLAPEQTNTQQAGPIRLETTTVGAGRAESQMDPQMAQETWSTAETLAQQRGARTEDVLREFGFSPAEIRAIRGMLK